VEGGQVRRWGGKGEGVCKKLERGRYCVRRRRGRGGWREQEWGGERARMERGKA